MKLKNWIVDDKGITSSNSANQSIFISKGMLNKICISNGKKAYQCFLDILKYNWVRDTELENFRLVFLYAIGKLNQDFDESLYQASLSEQQRLMAAKRIHYLSEQSSATSWWS
ncbi:hypothetical protein [Pedobacter sp. SYSU D00535]|uniref:hypothetical protein n=1 Tax=Pedobacter sp. SYSU D00535 TaxID=2810308 RepID=UPI001A9784C8|nr:hypothetical protein [Pedobacter sp. SYSU D00535]